MHYHFTTQLHLYIAALLNTGLQLMMAWSYLEGGEGIWLHVNGIGLIILQLRAVAEGGKQYSPIPVR